MEVDGSDDDDDSDDSDDDSDTDNDDDNTEDKKNLSNIAQKKRRYNEKIIKQKNR